MIVEKHSSKGSILNPIELKFNLDSINKTLCRSTPDSNIFMQKSNRATSREMINIAFQFDTTKERSELMKKIHSTETHAEVSLRKALWRRGYRYRKNYLQLPGKPDIAITAKKIAIFVDGEFWHGYDWDNKKRRIKANRDYWITKIEKNMQHDHVVDISLQSMGWTVIRFWEHEIKHNIERCIETIDDTIFQQVIDRCADTKEQGYGDDPE